MHKIDIPPSIIDACIARRGRRHGIEVLDPARTALVVIDMQNGWLEPGLSPLEIPQARTIVSNINDLAHAMRAAGGIVAWTQSTFTADWTHFAYAHLGDGAWRERIIADTVPGSHGFALYPALDYRSDDITCTKTRPSALIQGSSDLEQRLRDAGRDTIVITGTLTNACCESTARDAAALGFRNIMVSDGMATRSDIEHNATLINVMQLVADVMTANEVLDLLKPHLEAARRAKDAP